MSRELSHFSYMVLGLVGRGGLNPYDLRQMVRRGRIYDWVGESQYYVEPKRLARLGYLDARKEPGKTRERTVYTLTDKGLAALREWAGTPVHYPRMEHEPLTRVLVADLVGEAAVRESLGTLRTTSPTSPSGSTRPRPRPSACRTGASTCSWATASTAGFSPSISNGSMRSSASSSPRAMPDVKLSHPDKVLFPEDGLTKADLAEYYASVAEWMLPHVRDRPLNLWRWNTGIDGKLVVQQDIPKGAPDWVARVETPRRKGGSDRARALPGRRHAALAGQPELHHAARLERAPRPARPPDHIVFDFDPEAGSDFALVREGGAAGGRAAARAGAASRSRWSPAPRASTCRADQAHARRRRGCASGRGELGVEIAERSPDTLTTEWRKEKRDGKILVDTARNTYGQTVVAPYAVRALPGAPVATPLEWEELSDPELSARSWTLRTVGERLAERGDPWAGIAGHAAALPG